MDAKSIAMSMIKKGDRKNCIALSEFTTSGVASGRGGEHAFVWYYDGTYDPYYQAPDLDWSVIKKNDRQNMLLFCYRLLYCLFPLFTSNVCFIHGGLSCNGISNATTNFMFPHLHNMKKKMLQVI